MTDKRKDLWLICLIVLSVFLIYGRHVLTGSFTASGDFGPAVSYALNFKEAVHNGQWIPRWIVIAREVTLGSGSLDGTPITVDSPVYQYYGFLQSALAFIFLCLKIPAIVSTQLVVILVFIVSGIALYFTGRLLGANRSVSFLSAYSYIISPWLVSNFYGRGGISEAMGQGMLPLLLLGYAYAVKNNNIQAMSAVAIAVFALALSHNIFLLYGVILVALLGLASLKFKAPLRACVLDIKIPLVLAAGAFLGLAASSWQWWPVLMTLKEVSFYYIGSFSQIYKVPANMADLSGAWGLPKQFLNGDVKREFFFTIGWWTIPAILSLIRARRDQRSTAFAVFVSFAVFFFLTYCPKIIFPHLPGCFGATQFTFRLLAFLSVLGSFAFCIGVPKLSRQWAVILFILITLSQIQVINFHIPKQQFPDHQYLAGYEYSAYYANSPREENLRHWFDGWLDDTNVLHLQDFKNKPIYLKVTGKLRDKLGDTELFIAPIGDPKNPASNRVKVKGGEFEALFKIQKPMDNLRLYSTKTVKPDWRHLSIRPEIVSLFYEPFKAFVPASDVERIEANGYKRVFRVSKEKLNAHHVPQGTVFTIELPMIYNRFSVAFQDGKPLAKEIDFNHRLNVKTSDLTSPIVVRYSLPSAVYLISIAGLSVFCFFLGYLYLTISRVRKIKLKVS